MLLPKLQSISDQFSIEVHVSYVTKSNTKYHNEFISIKPNQSTSHYFKDHLFSPLGETDFFESGLGSKTFETILGNTGLAICNDLRFPEHLRSLSKSGAQFILVSAHWLESRINHWGFLLQARAIENLCFEIGIN
jgi:omega-amidase